MECPLPPMTRRITLTSPPSPRSPRSSMPKQRSPRTWTAPARHLSARPSSGGSRAMSARVSPLSTWSPCPSPSPPFLKKCAPIRGMSGRSSPGSTPETRRRRSLPSRRCGRTF
eukprot:scaffold4227_cov62-Phaeocystis_antarctica.AAC.2